MTQRKGFSRTGLIVPTRKEKAPSAQGGQIPHTGQKDAAAERNKSRAKKGLQNLAFLLRLN